MFEFLKLLTEATGRALSTVAAHHKDKKKRDLAVELFVIYVRLNEAMVHAEDILEQLKAYVRRGTARREEAARQLRWRLSQQAYTLRTVQKALKDNSATLVILDAEEYNRLMRMVLGKLSDLDMIAHDLSGRRLHLGAFPSRFEEDDEGAVGRRRTDVVLDLDGARDASLPQIRRYVRSRAPHRRVEEIRSSLEHLRALLAETFSIEDVLIDVGSRKRL
jgi:hypothetical protein